VVPANQPARGEPASGARDLAGRLAECLSDLGEARLAIEQRKQNAQLGGRPPAAVEDLEHPVDHHPRFCRPCHASMVARRPPRDHGLLLTITAFATRSAFWPGPECRPPRVAPPWPALLAWVSRYVPGALRAGRRRLAQALVRPATGIGFAQSRRAVGAGCAPQLGSRSGGSPPACGVPVDRGRRAGARGLARAPVAERLGLLAASAA
jgi:hypothetical protein